MVQIKIKKITEDSQLPILGSQEAGCWDVFAREIEHHPEGRTKIRLGFATEFDESYQAHLVPRSGITKFGLVMPNSPGQIDADYRGEWMIVYYKLRVSWWRRLLSFILIDQEQPFPYTVGDRVGQFYLRKKIPINFIEVNELSVTERGEGGFHSTGTK